MPYSLAEDVSCFLSDALLVPQKSCRSAMIADTCAHTSLTIELKAVHDIRQLYWVPRSGTIADCLSK